MKMLSGPGPYLVIIFPLIALLAILQLLGIDLIGFVLSSGETATKQGWPNWVGQFIAALLISIPTILIAFCLALAYIIATITFAKPRRQSK